MSALDQLQSAADANLEAANASLDAARQAQTEIARLAAEGAAHGGVDPLVLGLTVFVLAIFVGYYVVWRVTPALHTPLMAVTNAISGIIVVGAIIAAGPATFGFATVMGFLAVTLASVNIFGGFVVTNRMLQMFKKKG
ncbi:NAD(P) transhydrogenase subunit alpha [uncultured Tistrella sp.]|uniref:NAD(P) transhydrogenase subunit alpha n=1 Tax=Tistrella mobilis TaxID=171437 RepID=UPI000C09F662|nr:NAD(P) transhydrogenase subunit alpha [uncultured Tistrella sp.]MAM73485.1 NAD synthetase [Tistrella sp.]